MKRPAFQHGIVRQMQALLLLLAFVLPVALPLLAATQDPEQNLPACCRRNGKHHCSMNWMQKAKASQHEGWQQSFIREKCPYNAKTAPGGTTVVAIPSASWQQDYLLHPQLLLRALAHSTYQRKFGTTPQRGPPFQI